MGAQTYRLAALALSLTLAAAACGSDGEEPGGAAGAAGAAGDASVPGFRESACGSCVVGTCQSAEAACASDAECAAHLSCLYACPVGSDGNADPSCEAACPAPSSAGSQQLLAAFDACRDGSGCPCGGDGGTSCPHPLLCQDCPGNSPNPDACQACFQNGCCESLAACSASSGCQAIRSCMATCPTNSTAAYWDCEIACGMQHPDDYHLIRELSACLPYHCPNECGGAAASCLSCTKQHCAAAQTACWSNVECSLILGCGAHCPVNDTACTSACAEQHPTAKPAFDAMLGCITNHCSDVCIGFI